jgi:hypothetical protein
VYHANGLANPKPMNRPISMSFEICNFLVGDWKRCMEMREFGGVFQHVKCVNTILHFEEVVKNNVKYILWTIQKKDTKTTYEMKVTVGEGEVLFQDPSQGLSGKYINQHKALLLTIVSNSSLWSIAFRIVNENQMSLNMSQIDGNPVIQYGNVFRL